MTTVNAVNNDVNLVPVQETPPPPANDANFIDGPRTGTKVGSFDGGELHAGQRAQTDFATFEEAAAYARGTGESTAIVVEQGRYVVYQTVEKNNGSWLLSSGDQFTHNNAVDDSGGIAAATSGTDPYVVALVTDDAYLIDLSTNTAPLAGPVSGPFAGRVAVYGPDLASITDRKEFEAQFELALRDTALYSLDQAETVAQGTLSRLQGNQFTAQDAAAIARVTPELQRIDAEIDRVKDELWDARWGEFGSSLLNPLTYLSPAGNTLLRPTGLLQTPQQRAAAQRVDALSQELADLQQQRINAAQEFPLLLRVDLEKFTAASPAEQVAQLREETESVIEDIATTRQNVIDGDFNLWTNSALRATVARGLGLSEQRTEWVDDKAASDATWEAVTSVGTAVVGIGLSIGGVALAPFSAGSSLTATVAGTAMLAGGVSISLYDAITTTDGYLRDQAAANTALDPNAGLLSPEDAGHWGWVALAWVGVGLDAADAVRAVSKLAQAGKTVDDLLAATPEAQRALQETAEQLGTTPTLLREALEQAGTHSLSTQVLSSPQFTRAFGSPDANAVTLLNRAEDGSVQVQIVFRDGLTPAERTAALAEETTHLRQLLNEPQFASHLDNLSEATLANWDQLSDTQKLQAFQSNLTLEIDAQQRLIAEAADSPQAQLITETATDRLAAMQRQLNEVNEALASGVSPSWLDNAAAPRLFNEPRYVVNNAAAVQAGYDDVADYPGYYYAHLGGDQYQLRRLPSVDPSDVTPIHLDGKQIVPGGTVRTTAAERRAALELRFAEPLRSAAAQPLEQAMTAAELSPALRAQVRYFGDSLINLNQIAGDGAAQRIISQMAEMSPAQAETFVRRQVRAQTVEAIRELPASQQLAALNDAADALPNANKLRGELFTAYREASMPAGFQALDPPTNSLHVAASGRPADGLVQIDAAALPTSGIGPETAGRYLVEDKFGGSFSLDQARAYSDAVSNGTIASRNGQLNQGVIYVFENAAQAQSALAKIDEAGLSDVIHVATLTQPGTLTWLR